MVSTTTAPTETAELLPGYYIEPATGAWLTLPWPGDPSLPWGHAERVAQLPPSLGPQCIWWGQQWLLDYWSGRPWKYTSAQARFLRLWWSVRDDGRWVSRSGVKRGAKGTGKDPLAAAMANTELCGPVRFTGEFAEGGERAEWDPRYIYEPGEPIGMPHRLALVQIAANSEAQAADVLRVANAMCSRAMREEYAVDKGITRTQLENGSRIELLTNSERSSEGDPATAIILNESHHMTESSGGQALAGVARRNVGKSPGGIGRVCEFTNAHLPGEGSVAEESFEAWQAQVAGHTRREDILYDSREAAPSLRLHVEEELELGIAQAYADSPWSDQERIRDEAQDPRVPVQDSVRYYFNALPTNELAWADPRQFDSLADASVVTSVREPIAMFLDCSKSTDSTALQAARLSDGFGVSLRCWQRPHGDRGTGWLAPRHEVDAEVRARFAHDSVLWFGVDPSPAKDDETEAQYWAQAVDEWHRDFREKVALWATPGTAGNAVMFDMRLSAKGGFERNRLFVEQAELVATAIDEGTFRWDGDPFTRLHVHNARRHRTRWGVSLGKHTRDSSNLVDMAVAMVGAQLGRRLLLNSGKALKKQRSGVVW